MTASAPSWPAPATSRTPGRAGPLRAEAAALYRGDFLAGFAMRDSPEFDDWQFYTAESLRRALAGALEALTEDCVATGALAEAIEHARRWLALDPLQEAAHRTLMALYAWNDQRGAQSWLIQMIDKIHGAGGEAEGDLGHDDPAEAAKVSLERRSFDEVIVPTLPAGLSRWLRMDLPSRVARMTDAPVTTVEAEADTAAP